MAFGALATSCLDVNYPSFIGVTLASCCAYFMDMMVSIYALLVVLCLILVMLLACGLGNHHHVPYYGHSDSSFQGVDVCPYVPPSSNGGSCCYLLEFSLRKLKLCKASL